MVAYEDELQKSSRLTTTVLFVAVEIPLLRHLFLLGEI